ncbi:hypothetical protein HanXRQr2_Chr05g0232901 [Helianthus annuus]|uniref:Uncharacterized protein n=1 Tax=Helianthus annuus TaxID=4232 RepID=A0A251URV7_HELAN|nr:hypothetical protein HanXRQr2_Chr05g0232901 [Helianthus annuus]KAJ0924127.1 hypothetical protein HanPSC8_Chr05g0224661 [Helianthus annuus]
MYYITMQRIEKLDFVHRVLNVNTCIIAHYLYIYVKNCVPNLNTKLMVKGNHVRIG